MARLRVLPVTINTTPTSILVLDQATPDQASMVGAIPTEALREAGIPPILALPFEVALPGEDTTPNDHDVTMITADIARSTDVLNELRKLNTQTRTRQARES